MKQLNVPLKIHADFESLLKGFQSNDRNNKTSYTQKYQDRILCRLAYKVVCLDDKLSKPVVFYRRKNAVNRFIEAILKEYDYCKKNNKKAF